MYRNGEDVPEDDAEAVRWYRLAAEQWSALSQYQLGSMYSDGEGVPQDDVLAYMWWNLAAANGHELAPLSKDLPEAVVLTREQIAEAQRMSREWMAEHPRGGN
jgi:TPR repeat protein